MSAARGRPFASPFAPAALVARFSLKELVWYPRTLAMVVVAFVPLGLALLYRLLAALEVTGQTSAFAAFSSIIAGALFPFVAPMVALFYATGVVSDDVEAGTMPYFLTRPLTRDAFLAGKMIASFAMALLLLLPAVTLSYYAILAPSGLSEVGRRFPVLVQDLAVAALGLAAYNGIFALLGTALRRPLLAGLFFIFGWQSGATFVPGAARYLTVAHYLQSLTPHPAEGGLAALFSERSPAGWSIGALLLIAAGTHVLALRIFARKEVR